MGYSRMFFFGINVEPQIRKTGFTQSGNPLLFKTNIYWIKAFMKHSHTVSAAWKRKHGYSLTKKMTLEISEALQLICSNGLMYSNHTEKKYLENCDATHFPIIANKFHKMKLFENKRAKKEYFPNAKERFYMILREVECKPAYNFASFIVF